MNSWTTYTPDYLKHVFSVIDVFAGYDNTLGFLAGNEVIFDTESAKTSPNYVKATVRDMKAYMQNHVSRVIPVGYSNADSLQYRTSLAAYLECGDTGYIDFWGVNSYQWCGDNTFTGSGYDTLVESYNNYSLPIIFTEYGCNEVTPRKFQETVAIYSDDMTGVFSGGLVYEFIQEDNNYGLVELKDDNAETMTDFKTYKSQLAKADFANAKIPSSAKTNARPSSCPKESSAVFDNITANLTLPTTLGADMIKNGVSVTRGKFSSKVSNKSKYTITLDGSKVSDNSIKATNTTNEAPLASGGHSGDNGSGTSASSSASASGNSTSSAILAATPKGSMGVASLVVVAFGFGLFL